MDARRFSLLLALVLIPLWTQPISFADQPANGPDAGLLTIRGQVFLADGSPARAATVASTDPSGLDGKRTKTDDASRFELTGVFGSGAQLHAFSPDRSQQVTRILPSVTLRAASAAPIELRLAPAELREATVTADGKPVEGVHVFASGRAFQVEGITGADGKVSLQCPAGAPLHAVTAWHPQRGIDGAYDSSERAPLDAGHLSLRPAKPRTLRAVDAAGQPVANLQLGINIRIQPGNWILARAISELQVRTDAAGLASIFWAPSEGLLGFDVDLVDSTWKVDKIDGERSPAGEWTVHVRRKRFVAGRLILPEGASAEGLLITGFAFGPANRGDVPYARAGATAHSRCRLLMTMLTSWALSTSSGPATLGQARSCPAPATSRPTFPSTFTQPRRQRFASPAGPTTGAWPMLGSTSDRVATWKLFARAEKRADGGPLAIHCAPMRTARCKPASAGARFTCGSQLEHGTKSASSMSIRTSP